MSKLQRQVSNLLCRGFPTRRPHDRQRPADWKSAIQQVGNLRYVSWRQYSDTPYNLPTPENGLLSGGIAPLSRLFNQ